MEDIMSKLVSMMLHSGISFHNKQSQYKHEVDFENSLTFFMEN